MMKKTRGSLYYLASYLLTGGLGFLVLPNQMLSVFMSNGEYSDVMLRLVGLMLLSLGIFIVQLIRYKIEKLYPSTLLVRSIILTFLLAFYFVYKDPLFLVLFVIVGFGFVLTTTSFFLDRKKSEHKVK
jgi:uncharacterized protein YjeT (DUF2065 family)